jgi:hypothetical protein
MKSWSAVPWVANKISMGSIELADWLEITGFEIKWIFY